MEKQKEDWIKVGIGEAYHNINLDEFKGDQKALKEVREYVENIHKARENGVGLFCYGDNGTGKSYLCYFCLQQAMKTENPKTRRNYSVFKTTLSKIVSSFTKGWYDDSVRQKFEKIIIGSDFLFIDDVEKAFVRSDDKATTLQVAAIDMVLRERLERRRPILMTSNYKPSVLTDAFGPSVGSLLKGNMLLIEFKGEDYRYFDDAKKRWKEALSG